MKQKLGDELKGLGNWCIACFVGIPAALIALHLLTGDDLRYWPSSMPEIYAPVLGVLMMALSAWMFWYAIRSGRKS
jgi:hypothetical protein